MTIWLCDRCGKQVKRIAQSAGKYRVKKTIYDDEFKIYDGCIQESSELQDAEVSETI